MNAPIRQRVLIAEDEQVASAVVQRIIEKAGYEVVVVRDGNSALREIEKGDFYAVVADWMLPELDGIEVVRHVTSQRGTKTKAFLTSVIDIPAAREHAVAAGALDFLPKPITPAALMKALRTELKPVAPKAHDGNHPLARSATWPKLPMLAEKSITDLLGTEVGVELVSEIAEMPVGLTCGLVDASNGTELTSWIAARESAAVSVAATMLGEDPANAQEAVDAMAEVLNVVAGSLKMELGTSGFKFTIVLPKRISPADLRKLTQNAFASIITTVTLGETSFTLGFSGSAANAVEMKVEDLREGHVLAEDIRNASGTLILLPACTRLTATAVQRLREHFQGKIVRVYVPLASAA